MSSRRGSSSGATPPITTARVFARATLARIASVSASGQSLRMLLRM